MGASGRAERDRRHFDRIVEAYCEKDLLPASALARRERLERTLTLLPRRGGRRILDAGCGAGFTARYLGGRWREYLGVDHSEALIGVARRHNAGPGRSFQAGSLLEVPPGGPDAGRFDTVLMIGVLHHLEAIEPVLARLVELLEPGGWVVANEPQPANPLVHLARRVRRRLDPTYSGEQVELSARQLEAAFAAAGLEEIRIRAQGFLSTPFAEVVLPAQTLALPLARLACAIDRRLERLPGRAARFLSWNLVAAGRKPLAS